MKIEQKPRFNRIYKKLPDKLKSEIDSIIRMLCENPDLGILKVGNLSGIRIYKFKLNKQPVLLAYQWKEERAILIMLSIGSHENFYRDLAKQ